MSLPCISLRFFEWHGSRRPQHSCSTKSNSHFVRPAASSRFFNHCQTCCHSRVRGPILLMGLCVLIEERALGGLRDRHFVGLALNVELCRLWFSIFGFK